MPILSKRLDADTVKNSIDIPTFWGYELPAMKLPRGNGWADGGCCPFHDDRRAGSFRVNCNTGAFRCFSCGSNGSSIVDFVMLRDGLSFREALSKLAQDWGLRP